MKKVLFCVGLFIVLTALFNTVSAQSIIDAEEDNNFNNFYDKSFSVGKEAMPYAYLRETDVVWEYAVWRTIDFREKFNQFFYFPTDATKNTQGRVSLTNLIIQALKNGDIEVFKDDDMKETISYAEAMAPIEQTRTLHIAEYDDWGEEMEGRDTIITNKFQPEEVYSAYIKEYWYIDKQDTRQKVRIVGLALVYNYCKDRDGDRICDPIPLFWVPMNDMRVRNVLANAKAYDENNINAQRSYDDIFVQRYFDSFITRESNRMNRSIASYLTGQDAILESQNIENKIWDIESDMWEY